MHDEGTATLSYGLAPWREGGGKSMYMLIPDVEEEVNGNARGLRRISFED